MSVPPHLLGMPVYGVIPQQMSPVQFQIQSPMNCETIFEFMAHDAVVQAVILQPYCNMSLQAPPSANMLRWKQVDQMNAHVRRAASEILRGELG